MKKFVFLFAALFLIASGCNIIDEINSSCKVTKVVSNQGTTTYEYSTGGLLTNVESTELNMKIVIAYNSGGKVSKIEYYNSTGDSLLFYMDYNWINTQKIESGTYFKTYSGEWWQVDKTVYELNGDGDPVKVSYYEKDMNDQWYVDHYKELIWDKGNIVRIEFFTLNESDGSFINDRTSLFAYDDNVNPWRGLSIKSVIVDDADILCTANNPLGITTTDNVNSSNSESVTFMYEYNSDKYPVSYTKTHHYDNGTPEETETVSSIEYDCN